MVLLSRDFSLLAPRRSHISQHPLHLWRLLPFNNFDKQTYSIDSIPLNNLIEKRFGMAIKIIPNIDAVFGFLFRV